MKRAIGLAFVAPLLISLDACKVAQGPQASSETRAAGTKISEQHQFSGADGYKNLCTDSSTKKYKTLKNTTLYNRGMECTGDIERGWKTCKTWLTSIGVLGEGQIVGDLIQNAQIEEIDNKTVQWVVVCSDDRKTALEISPTGVRFFLVESQSLGTND